MGKTQGIFGVILFVRDFYIGEISGLMFFLEVL